MTKFVFSLQVICLSFFIIMPPVIAKTASLLETYPHSSVFNLQDGTPIDLPLHVADSEGLVLAGLADYEFLKQQLASKNLKPFQILKGKGLVMFFSMNYKEAQLGPYQELVMLVATEPNSKSGPFSYISDLTKILSMFIPGVNQRTDIQHKNVPFYMWKLFVTTQLSMDVGIQLWGYPKSLSETDVAAQELNSHFSVSEQNGTPIVSANQASAAKSLNIPISIDMRMVSFLNFNVNQKILSRGIAQGRVSIKLFSKKNDYLSFNSATEWGSNFKTMQFKPLAWLVMPKLEVVFLDPRQDPENRPFYK